MASIYTRALMVLIASACLIGQVQGAEDDRPDIIIYPGEISPGYGLKLREIIEGDGRIQAEIHVLDDPDIFRLMLFFPNVKLAIISAAAEKNEGLGNAIEWFFQGGGGLISLGLAASDYSVGNVSETVFPIFGNTYQTGIMDGNIRKFKITHVKQADDEISDEIGDFTVIDHKILLSYNSSTKTFSPREPEVGDYKVLYREKMTGAPSIVKYQNVGVSVTFASFGGDDLVSGFAYYGSYADTPEFRKLFANSVYWAWTNEVKNEPHLEAASSFYQDREDEIAMVREVSETRESRSKTNRNLRVGITIVLAAVGCVGVYWATFRRPNCESGGQ